jgi:hypothetical protein
VNVIASPAVPHPVLSQTAIVPLTNRKNAKVRHLVVKIAFADQKAELRSKQLNAHRKSQ